MSYKNGGCDAVVGTDRARPLLRRRRTLVQTDAIPCTTEDHRLFKKIGIQASRHIKSTQSAKRRQENLEWESSNGLLTFDIKEANFN